MKKIPKPFLLTDTSNMIFTKVKQALWHLGRRADAKGFETRVRGLKEATEGEMKLWVLEVAKRYCE